MQQDRWGIRGGEEVRKVMGCKKNMGFGTFYSARLSLSVGVKTLLQVVVFMLHSRGQH